jgi:hypothetical protein
MGIHILSLSILDDEGSLRAVNYHLADTATLAQVQTFLDAHLNKLEALVGGVINSATINLGLTLTAPNNILPLVDHPVDNGAIAGFSAVGTAYRHSIYLPTFRKSLITAGVVDVAGAFTTWYTSLLNGEAVIDLTNKAGQSLQAFLSSKRTNRK